MGDCVICGKPAGLFKRRHAACAQAFEAERAAERRKSDAERAERERTQQIKAGVKRNLELDAYSTLRSGGDLVALEHRILDAIEEGLLTHPEKTELLISGWEKCVDQFLDDGLIDDEEAQRLDQYENRFVLSQSALNRNGAAFKVAKSGILRAVMKGELPNVDVAPGLPVNFQKSETPVWTFANCQYMEDVVRKQYVGGSQGMSFRIMKGVYYRVGGFKGESISTIERRHLGTGILVATDRNLYFVGPGKTTRIPYSKIVSFTPFGNGIGVMRDLASAKPQFFITGEGWFTYNLITNLARL